MPVIKLRLYRSTILYFNRVLTGTKLRYTDNPLRNESYRQTEIDKHALKFTKKHKQAKLEFTDQNKLKKTESPRSK